MGDAEEELDKLRDELEGMQDDYENKIDILTDEFENRIDSLEDKVSINLDEKLYSELLSLRNQLKSG